MTCYEYGPGGEFLPDGQARIRVIEKLSRRQRFRCAWRAARRAWRGSA